MLNLYVKKANGELELIEKDILGNTVFPILAKYFKNCNNPIYYVRSWNENGNIIYDVGSHMEFFVLKEQK